MQIRHLCRTLPPAFLVAPPLLVAALGCSGPGAPDMELMSHASQPLESWHNYAVVSPVPGGRLGVAARATGAVLTPLRGPNNQQLLAGDGVSGLRGSCGVTFISPHYAVTAAHCVPSDIGIQLPATQSVTVEMYRLAPNITGPTSLQGAWPNFTHTALGAGYDTDHYTCRLAARCADGKYQCPGSNDDIAMLRCDAPQGKSPPGKKYGYSPIAGADLPNVDVQMPWKHEVYTWFDVHNPNTDYFQHYSQYAGNQQSNFHYFGADGNGVEHNQLLPLLPAVPGRKFAPGATTLEACHGTSGSGVLQLNGNTGAWELLGNALTAPQIGTQLCNDETSENHNATTMTYSSLAATQYVHGLLDVCEAPAPRSPDEPLGFLLPCDRVWMNVVEPNLTAWPRPWNCLSCPPVPLFDIYRLWNEPLLSLTGSAPLSLPAATYEMGKRYRVSIRTFVASGTSGTPSLTIQLGGQIVVANAPPVPAADDPRFGLVTAMFVPATAGDLSLQIAPGAGSSALAIGEVSVATNAGPTTFDTASQQMWTGVLTASSTGPTFDVAPFTSDGQEGLAAVLHGGERLVMTRRALLPASSWLIDLRVDPGLAGVTCGMILTDGSEVSTWCAATAGSAHGLLSISSAAQPLAFFVDAPTTVVQTRVDDVVLCADPVNPGMGICDP